MTQATRDDAGTTPTGCDGREGAGRERAATAVPLHVDSPAATAASQPVTVGIPFPKGALRDPGTLALFDDDGRAVGLQAEPLARWSDGSVKWLLLDFLLGARGGGRARWELREAPAAADRGHPPALRVREGPGGVAVETGVATFEVGRGKGRGLLRSSASGRDLLEPGSFGLELTDARGRARAPRVEAVAVEARGPVRASVRVIGRFAGRAPCRFVARLCFFAGTGLVRLRLTVRNPRRARHPGGLWDLGDPGSILFRDLSLRMELAGAGRPRVAWQSEVGGPIRDLDDDTWEIYQDSSGGENWRGRNHVNRHGRVPTSFRGYRVRVGGREEAGLRASPVASLHADRGGLAVAVPEFWQQFPKAIRVEGRGLRVGLFPGQFADLHEIQGGEQKTHTVWLDFIPGARGRGAPLDWVHRPAAVQAGPEWYAASGAVPSLPPDRGGRGNPLDALLSDDAGGVDGLVARREAIDEYGWRNFGDVHADHEGEYYEGPTPVASHYNNQYDMVLGFLLQAMRTGDPRWAELYGPLALHVADIDIYHTGRDKAAYNGGLFWFTDHYKDAATSTHRTYSRVNCRPGDRTYGGGPSSNHNFTSGLLHYHYLTGDPEARDAVVGLADWVVRMDDGRRTALGLVDRGPTGLASFSGDPGYHGPGRGCGNSIHALLDAWLLTGRRAYLDKAEELIRRSVHPGDDVAARGLLDVEKRWSYTVFLAALARYLDAKAEAGELGFMYAYARAGLVAYARWMLGHEVPYFDRPEALEYPTEAWAGQDLRKANVLRLAAAHADGDLRVALARRGDELAERAWSDLRRFASRASARGLALAMAEGTWDLALRGRPAAPSPRPDREYDFESPRAFIPQKARVLARIRSVRGLARLLAGPGGATTRTTRITKP